MNRIIFFTGGVVSSLGKGVAISSLGALLQSRGYTIKIKKLDPYLNIDPGTMNPTQHGEVFVTEDGCETDLDFGHYERFTNINATKHDTSTTGKIYAEVIRKERAGEYLGQTVQVIPHITDAIKEFCYKDTEKFDFTLIEIGGTVGDIESLPFLESIRQIKNENSNAMVIHLTLIVYLESADEIKTKPTQHSVKELMNVGIQPDILLCRTSKKLQQSEINKIASFCNVKNSFVVQAPDCNSIYEVPNIYHQEGLDTRVMEFYNLTSPIDLSQWSKPWKISPQKIKIGIVGKYIGVKDSYKSLTEALLHSCQYHDLSCEMVWIDAENYNPAILEELHGIIVPGGFGKRGYEGKLTAIKFAREKKIPFLGICLGMQLAVIETAMNCIGLHDVGSQEFGDYTHTIVGIMEEAKGNMGGTLRLGSYPAILEEGSKIHSIYGSILIHERHRHRYEVDVYYESDLILSNMVFSGLSPDGNLPECVEIKDHPFFIGVQFHPELKSRPFNTHPLFDSFIDHSYQFSISKSMAPS